MERDGYVPLNVSRVAPALACLVDDRDCRLRKFFFTDLRMNTMANDIRISASRLTLMQRLKFSSIITFVRDNISSRRKGVSRRDIGRLISENFLKTGGEGRGGVIPS